jgi:L-alanine-DL-glutamate epimerase-like enolase superfamily enzyme
VLTIAELAALYRVEATPHTSNSAIGIAAALQVLACLPPYTRSPATLEPLLEYGVDDSPWRRTLLKEDFEMSDGWVRIPDGPGFGIEIDEEHLESVAIEKVGGSA